MRNDYQHISVMPIAGSLGAEIGDVDLAADNPDGVYNEIHRALLENLVIFFRDQAREARVVSHVALAAPALRAWIHRSSPVEGRPLPLPRETCGAVWPLCTDTS